MKSKVKVHIVFWTAYVLYDWALEYAWMRGSYASSTTLHLLLLAFLTVLIILPPKMLLAYFVLRVTIGRGIMEGRKAIYLVLELIPVLAASIVSNRLIAHYIVERRIYYEHPWGDKLWDTITFINSFIGTAFATGWAVAMESFRMFWVGREREKGLVKEKLEAELMFLRTQTNPHFLFNTLNNIYALARKKSDDTANVVMKLSKLLRFMLYESRKERIPLADELRMIDDYLELQKIRYNERLKIDFYKEIDDPARQVSPLLLLPFIENAFKHGVSETRFDSYIRIDTILEKGTLQFFIENSTEANGEEEINDNIGLSNVRRQLELMYTDYNLDIKSQEKKFAVNLTINLNHDKAL